MPGYEYFCGANVVLTVEGQPILEAAGLSYNVRESKMPIYGYASRFFDAVASGQVIVEGSLLINYVDQDYLAASIEMGLNRQGFGVGGSGDEFGPKDSPFGPVTTSGTVGSSDLHDALDDAEQRTQLLHEYFQNPSDWSHIPEALRQRFFTNDLDTGNLFGRQFTSNKSAFYNPHDSYGGIEIHAMFGNRSVQNNWLGDHGFILEDVYFVGRGKQIRIDEEVIVEEHQFFARNARGVDVNYGAHATYNAQTGESSITVGNKTLFNQTQIEWFKKNAHRY